MAVLGSIFSARKSNRGDGALGAPPLMDYPGLRTGDARVPLANPFYRI